MTWVWAPLTSVKHLARIRELKGFYLKRLRIINKNHWGNTTPCTCLLPYERQEATTYYYHSKSRPHNSYSTLLCGSKKDFKSLRTESFIGPYVRRLVSFVLRGRVAASERVWEGRSRYRYTSNISFRHPFGSRIPSIHTTRIWSLGKCRSQSKIWAAYRPRPR